jgi:hypothetical protein
MKRRSILFLMFLFAVCELVGQSHTVIDSHNFIVRYPDRITAEFAYRVLEQLESDYRYFREYFNLPVDGRTSVWIYQSENSFLEKTGTSRWEYGYVDETGIHLHIPDNLHAGIVLSSVITQQVVRTVIYSRRMNGCPLWLYEGAASYFAHVKGVFSYPYSFQPQSFSDIGEHLLLATNEAEYTDAVLYSALTIETLFLRYGEANVITLLRLFNGSYDYETAIRYSLGVSPERAELNWRRDIQQLLTQFRDERGR